MKERQKDSFIDSFFSTSIYVSWKKRSETKLTDFNSKVTSALMCAEVKNYKVSKSAAAAAKSLQSCRTLRPHRWLPSRLPRPWDSPSKNTGVGCHFLLQCMEVKSESEVAQSCPTLSDFMDCSLPGSSVHGIFQARVLEWVAIAFSVQVSSNHNLTSERNCSAHLVPQRGTPSSSLKMHAGSLL